MKHQLEVSEQADRDLMPLIRKSFRKSAGRQTNDNDLISLRARVGNFRAASSLSALRNGRRRWRWIFKPYAQSLIDLQKMC